MELQAGQPQQKGNRRGSTYAYNIKELRAREMNVAHHAEAAYENFVRQWQPRGPKKRCASASKRQGTKSQAT